MGVHGRPLAGGREAEVDAEGGERGVRAGELAEVGVAGRAVLVARLAERVDADVEVAAHGAGP